MADKKLELRIISPGQEIDSHVPTTADMIILRCTTGDLGVLPGRTPCTMVLAAGDLRIINDGAEHRLTIDGGVASVERDVVTVLTEAAVLERS